MVNTAIRLIIFFRAEDGETLYSQQNQDLELAQIISSSLQKSGLNWRSFRQDLNQIPYDYTVGLTNYGLIKGLDLVDSVPEELWMEVHACPVQ